MQLVQIDKKKSPDIADWAADKEPGDRVCLYGTIKANDDQTLAVTVEEIEEDKSDDDAEKKNEEVGNDGSGDVVAKDGDDAVDADREEDV